MSKAESDSTAEATADTPDFRSLGLSEAILAALDAVGYEAPSPIQARTIPPLLAGRDVLGQAQTGTGKTAAFALPLIDRLDDTRPKPGRPRILVLTPTRELAIQVAEAFQRYASKKPGFHVLPIYGGQPYPLQARPLQRGVHVVVGTPGRVMDHLRRGTLDLSELKSMVLDEADEMLAMGFIEDVTWILDKTPTDRQIALFSATMPPAVRRIVKQYLTEPEEISIEVSAKAATTIRQRYLLISHWHKLDALTRMLEIEPVEGMLIFVRTKTATVELAEKLEARGHSAAALNGDMAQPLRERTVGRFKEGKLDFLVATDVAARGLDVDRITHVLNYDIPHDPEAYIHRIGRTGRAGRTGEAILFVTPREKRMFHTIEKTIGQSLEVMTSPSTDEVNKRRIGRFKERITEAREAGAMAFYEQLLEQYIEETGTTAIEAAAALAHLLQGSQPLLLAEAPKKRKPPERAGNPRVDPRVARGSARAADPRARPSRPASSARTETEHKPDSRTDPGMQRYRVEVGHDHGVKPGQIVGALINEAGLDAKFIGRIDIRGGFSLVDLPDGMPQEIFKALRKTRLCRQPLNISRDESSGGYKGKGKGTLKSKAMAKGSAKPHAHHPAPAKPPVPKKPRETSASPVASPDLLAEAPRPPKGPSNPGPPGGLKPPRSKS